MSLWKCCLLAIPSLILSPSIHAQSPAAATGSSAAPALRQLSSVFSGGQIVHQVQLTGNATWHSGSTTDSGSVTLIASSSGAAQINLSLSSLGERKEAQTGQGAAQACTWSGSDGVQHDLDPLNCWRPAIWFMPALSLQPSLLAGNVGIADLGVDFIGEGTYHHLQSQLVLSEIPATMTTTAMQASTTDIGLDPASALPSVLRYYVHPDSGSDTPISIEVRYSNYSAVNGVQIPFSIQKYVNGSLQLDLVISSARIN